VILVTVGGQLPFDRLIRTVDAWVAETGRTDVFCQIGDGAHAPEHTEWERFLSREEFHRRLLEARTLVAHAGMGTIITALENEKPVIVLPRKADLGEQRNDHQLATAARFRGRPGVHVAMDEEELLGELRRIDELAAAPPLGDRASADLLSAIREFIEQ
jgi:UDP-N-acetylglucosamine transferase subunit ALG13